MFGRGPLSHPLLVEALEDEFVPLAARNNVEGLEKRLLERFGEPAWNNPVLRFVAPDGADVVARRDRIWSTPEVARRLVDALAAAKRPVPEWLAGLAAELGAQRERALFTMHCFWEGEAAIGALPGVLATSAVDVAASASGTGKIEEGLLVEYDPATLPRERLVATWKTIAGAGRDLGDDGAALAAATPAKPSDRKHTLRAHPLWRLPMTPQQQARVNAALAGATDPLASLSPRQRLLARRILECDEPMRRALAAIEPCEELAGYAAWSERVATLFTQTGG